MSAVKYILLALALCLSFANANTETLAPLDLLLQGHSSSRTLQSRRVQQEHPRLQKFQQNIYYDQYYNESAVYEYVVAFYTGYSMQDYAFADECLQYSTESLDRLYEFNLNMTRRFSWNEPFFLVTNSAGGPVNDGWFYCYQYYSDFKLVYKTKYDNFVDFGDMYLSFIFNLLGNSLQIKQQTEDMIEASQRHDTVTYFQSFGSLLRMVMDFNSYKTAGQSLLHYATNAAKKDVGLQGVPSKQQRVDDIEERKAEARARVNKIRLERYLEQEERKEHPML